MGGEDKPLVWLHGEIRTPPLSSKARVQAGYLLRLLQRGDRLSMPHSRPMPTIGPRCHELRIPDEDAILILGVESKKTRSTPKRTIEACQRRLATYDQLQETAENSP